MDDTDWQDLVNRVPRTGLYAVVTTGVFCAFGCAARTPLRLNVRLFHNAAAARAAGYRPCKRCKP
jgi:AraC family transcriptional regulator, regulatory protein of adaptative response / methylated-DNA-[protein]-cysteine methyltransferase